MTTSFHFYLRKGFQKKNGEYPVYLRITHNRKHKYMSTGVSVLDKYWNPEKEIIYSLAVKKRRFFYRKRVDQMSPSDDKKGLILENSFNSERFFRIPQYLSIVISLIF